jgi:hypothetical protein
MKIAARLGLGLAVTLSLGVATLDAAQGSADKGAGQHFVCDKGGVHAEEVSNGYSRLEEGAGTVSGGATR